jgi:predicted nucleotidyltransferase
MGDDLSKRGGQDRQRINVNQEHELRDWAEKLGVSKERLKEAVQAVGDRADKVQEHLREGGDRKPAKRASER